jgi:hypothetical protein
MTRTPLAFLTTLMTVAIPAALAAHAGPPFPIVTDAVRGLYTISIWTDPDATDDGSAGGQFWIVIESSSRGLDVPPGTRATVSVHALNDATRGTPVSAAAAPVRGDLTNQFAAVLMDHEGPFSVHVEIDGPLGRVSVDSQVEATYDLRPPPYMLAWYLAPFLLVGFLWTRMLMRRRGLTRERSDRVPVP